MLDRLETLSPAASTVVRAGAVASGQLPHQLLTRVCGLEESEMLDASGEAVAAQVLEVDETGMAYRFRHALFQEAVLDSLLPAERVRWHRRWATALDEDSAYPDRAFAAIAAAHHWEGTGDVERAFDATVGAVAVARSLGAPSELAASLRRLLRLWYGVHDRTRHPAADRDLIVDEAIDALIQSDDWHAGLELIDEELDRPFSAEDRVRRTALQVRRRWFLQQTGSGDDGHPGDLARYLETLRDAPAGPLLVEALIRLGFDLVVSDPASAREAHRRAVAVATSLSNPRKEFWARSAMAMHDFLVGRAEEAVEATAGMLPSVRHDFPAEASHIEADCAWWLCCLGRYAEAEEMARSALSALVRPAQGRRSWAVATAHLCASLLATGRWDEASERLARSRALGITGTRGSVLHALAGILAGYRGDTRLAGEAVRAMSGLLPADDHSVWPPIRAWTTWLRMEVAADRDDVVGLRQAAAPLWAMPGLETASDVAWRPLLLAVRVEADLATRSLGRRGGVRQGTGDRLGEEHVERLGAAAARLHRYGPVGAAWRTHFEGEVARFRGGTDPEVWLDAARQWERVGHPADHAWALLRAGECQVARGDKRAASGVLRQAGEAAERLGASPLLAAVTDLVREARVDLGGGPQSGPRPRALALTDREIEVLTLIAFGRSNDEIAKELFISPKTASVHVSHILAKLGVRSRIEAATTAHRLRLV
jgi:DNA-binding CsgD family transcriptional regulator